MPLNLPDKLPAIELLKEENIFVIDNSRASSQDIRPLKIVVLNLMPIKITTETDLVRLLSNTPLQLEITFMKLKSHTSKNTPIEHMQAFYHDFDVLGRLFLFKARCNNGNAHLIVKVFVKCKTPDNVGIGTCLTGNHRGCKVNLLKPDIVRCGNADKDTLCTVNRGFKQRA